MRKVLMAVLLAMPMAASAQKVQLTDWAYEVKNLQIDAGAKQITGIMDVWNTFAYDPNRGFVLNSFSLFTPLGGDFLGTLGFAGNVNRAPIDAHQGGAILNPVAPWTMDGAGIGGGTWTTGMPLGTTNGYGIFGCSTPVLPNPLALGYLAQTCAPAGFDGSVRITFRLLYNTAPMPTSVSASDFQVRGLGVYWDAPSYLVTPEPSTSALFALGAMSLGLLAGYRRRT